MKGVTRRSTTAHVLRNSVIAASALLAACGDNPEPQPPSGVSGAGLPLKGTLVVPAGFDFATTCVDVPAGYAPLVAAAVAVLNAEGVTVLSGITTDGCGSFAVDRDALPAQATTVRAQAPGYRDVTTSIATFQSDSPDVPAIASTISASAGYEIGSLQKLKANEVVFTLTDSEYGKAVIGLPPNAVTITIDNTPAAVSDVVLAHSVDAASSALVLDASGSMYSRVTTHPDTGAPLTRFQLAAASAHLFLDQKPEHDELAGILFDTRVDMMDSATFAARFWLRDVNGSSVSVPFPTDGFTTDPVPLRLLFDAYDPYSQLYLTTYPDPRHADVPDVHIASTYPYAGSTALYDAIGVAIDRVAERSNLRRFVICMTDGENNASSIGLDAVIARARSANIPVYTVGFGASADPGLRRIADQTGASFFEATSTELKDAFSSIQSGIAYQYNATVGADLDAGSTVVLNIEVNGLVATRTLVVTASP